MGHGGISPSLTLCHTKGPKDAHSHVTDRSRVGGIVILHGVIGPVTEPQILTNKGQILHEEGHQHHGGVAPAHGTQVQQVDGELHLGAASLSSSELKYQQQ